MRATDDVEDQWNNGDDMFDEHPQVKTYLDWENRPIG